MRPRNRLQGAVGCTWGDPGPQALGFRSPGPAQAPPAGPRRWCGVTVLALPGPCSLPAPPLPRTSVLDAQLPPPRLARPRGRRPCASWFPLEGERVRDGHSESQKGPTERVQTPLPAAPTPPAEHGCRRPPPPGPWSAHLDTVMSARCDAVCPCGRRGWFAVTSPQGTRASGAPCSHAAPPTGP